MKPIELQVDSVDIPNLVTYISACIKKGQQVLLVPNKTELETPNKVYRTVSAPNSIAEAH